MVYLCFGTSIHEDHIGNGFHASYKLDTPNTNRKWSICNQLDKLKGLIAQLHEFKCTHVYKEANWVADAVSTISTKVLVWKSTILMKSYQRRKRPIFIWT